MEIWGRLYRPTRSPHVLGLPRHPGCVGLVSKPSAHSRAVEAQGGTAAQAVPVANLAASFQAAVVDVLVEKTGRAAEETQARTVVLAGGVAANELLRSEMSRRSPVPVRFPPLKYCTDNAAMVASAGFYRYVAGERAGWDLDVHPNLRLATNESV